MTLNPINFIDFLIVSPNGNEIIRDRTLTINWKETESPIDDPYSSDLDSLNYFYEIYFIGNYVPKSVDQDKIQIGTIYKNTKSYTDTYSFTWTIPYDIYGDRCRVGIVARKYSGEQTEIEYSANNFTIISGNLLKPNMLSPIDGAVYRNTVPIIFDNNIFYKKIYKNQKYRIYYKSTNLNIDWVLIYDFINYDQSKITWDIRSLNSSDDYTMKVVAFNHYGEESEPTYINDLTLKSADQFLIDTSPPRGIINIENASLYTNDRNIIVFTSAFDEGTAVKSVTLSSDANIASSITRSLSETISFLLPNKSGEQIVTASFEDYAGNIIGDEEVEDGVVNYSKGINSTPTALYFDKIDNYTIITDSNIIVSLTLYDSSGYNVPTDAYSLYLTIKVRSSGEVVLDRTEYAESSVITKTSTGVYTYDFYVEFGVEYIATWEYKMSSTQSSFSDTIQSYGPYVNDQYLDYSNVWVAYDNDGSDRKLFKSNQFITNLDYYCTNIFKYKEEIYVCGKSDLGYGFVQILNDDNTLSTLIEFEGDNSVITSSAVVGDYAYLGFANGNIYRFNSSSVLLIRAFDYSIRDLKNIYNKLYILINFINDIYVYDGSDFYTLGQISGI